VKISKIGKQYTSGVRPWLKNFACLPLPRASRVMFFLLPTV